MTLPSHGRGPRFESERAHLLETLKKAQKTIKISGMGQKEGLADLFVLPGVSVGLIWAL